MGKKPKHRVRHIPPGPCGVWFQATQAKKKQKRNDGRRQSMDSVEETPNIQQQQQQRADIYTQKDSPDKDKNDNDNMDTPSAWQTMQIKTGVTTPYNPTPWDNMTTNTEARYEVVRSNLPDHYVTLWEILRGDHDLKLAPHQRLRVLVHAIEMSNHHNIWTVDLRDDTGASMKAWMEPGFIQEQLQNSSAVDDEMAMIRPGMVWMLKNCSMIIMPSSSTAFMTGSRNNSNNVSEERLERMLLISKDHIELFWQPSNKKKNAESNGTMEQSQQSQSSGNEDDPAVIDLDGQSALKTPPAGAQHFGNGAQFAARAQQSDLQVGTENTTPPLNEESVSGLFNRMRQQQHNDNTASTEKDAILTHETNDRPQTQDLSQFAAPGARKEESAKTPPRNSSQNTVHTPPRQSQQEQESQQTLESRRKAPSLAPSDLSLDSAAALGSQHERPDLSQFRATGTNATGTMETGPCTQESMVRKSKENAQNSYSQQEPDLHTPTGRKEMQSSQRISQSSDRKKKKGAKSPARTPTRKGTLSPMTQDTGLLTPARTPTRKRKALSPKAEMVSNSIWNSPDSILLKLIEEDEAHYEKKQTRRSIAFEKESNQPLSQEDPAQNEQQNDSDYDSSDILPRKVVDCGTLYDPSAWEGVDMSILDSDDD